jgi:hypothetical protein
MEAMATDLYAREARVDLPADLIEVLADDHVERRAQDFATVYANVGCPATGELWFTFGGHPAASRGEWLPIAWPW